MARVSVRYWAGARAAAGIEQETFEATTAGEALSLARQLRSDVRFDRVLALSSILCDGIALGPTDLEVILVGDTELEVLPPFAGGAAALTASLRFNRLYGAARSLG